MSGDSRTPTAPTRLAGNGRALIPMRPLPPSATLTPPGYEEPIVWVASSTNTEWSPDAMKERPAALA